MGTCHFCTLLNPENDSNEVPIREQFDTFLVHRNFDNAVMDRDITLGDIFYAVQKAMYGKEAWIDEVPIKVLKNDTVLQFLTNLFQLCFKHSVVQV